MILHTLTPFSEGYRYRFGFLIPFLWFLKAVQEKQSSLQILDTMRFPDQTTGQHLMGTSPPTVYEGRH